MCVCVCVCVCVSYRSNYNTTLWLGAQLYIGGVAHVTTYIHVYFTHTEAI